MLTLLLKNKGSGVGKFIFSGDGKGAWLIKDEKVQNLLFLRGYKIINNDGGYFFVRFPKSHRAAFVKFILKAYGKRYTSVRVTREIQKSDIDRMIQRIGEI